MTSISIAMATYNGERFLPEQLASLAAQTFPIAELVVTDDTSSDRTIAILTDFAKRAPFPVRVEVNENRLGFRANFMKAASLCTSELIAFCDQDDVWYADKLEKVRQPFGDPDVCLVHHNAEITIDGGRRIGLLYPHNRFPATTRPMRTDPWAISNGFTQIFRRSLVDFTDLWATSVDTNSDGNRMAHDQWYFFLASVFGLIRYLDAPLADYRQHGNNTYGWHQEHTFLSRIPLWFEDRSTVYERCRLAAQSQQSILRSAASRLEGTWRSRGLQAAQTYQLLVDLYDLRAKLYTDHHLADRLSRFRRLIESNAYNSEGYFTFSRKGMAKDFVLGALLAPALRAFGYKASYGDPTCRIAAKDT
jgi:glycosyltransferase involved in cell wall biosynthesis